MKIIYKFLLGSSLKNQQKKMAQHHTTAGDREEAIWMKIMTTYRHADVLSDQPIALSHDAIFIKGSSHHFYLENLCIGIEMTKYDVFGF